MKLFRFLQEQCIERVGGRQEISVDTRAVAATSVQLSEAMTSGGFREGLYYRLAVVVIKLPALREREGDIQLLAQSFLQSFSAQIGKQGLTFDREAMHALGNTHGREMFGNFIIASIAPSSWRKEND